VFHVKYRQLLLKFNKNLEARSEVIAAVVLRILVFWYVTPCRLEIFETDFDKISEYEFPKNKFRGFLLVTCERTDRHKSKLTCVYLQPFAVNAPETHNALTKFLDTLFTFL
jgi:hypothetical protein